MIANRAPMLSERRFREMVFTRETSNEADRGPRWTAPGQPGDRYEMVDPLDGGGTEVPPRRITRGRSRVLALWREAGQGLDHVGGKMVARGGAHHRHRTLWRPRRSVGTIRGERLVHVGDRHDPGAEG